MKQKKQPLAKWAFVTAYLSLVAICVILDQLTKAFIFDGVLASTVGNSVSVLGNFLKFFAVYNEGAAFGMGQEEGANIVFFIVTVLGLPLFCWLLWRSRTRSACGQVGFAFIIGGTIGNAIDRAFVQSVAGKFFSGKVRDFISFSIFPPIFNVADSFLVIGVALALLAVIFFDYDALLPLARKNKKTEKAAEADEEKDEKN